MTKKRVLIACPAKGGIPAYWVKSAMDLVRNPHPQFEFEPKFEIGHGAINIARNIIAENAIVEDYWAVIQFDHDMHWKPADAVRLALRLLEVEFVYAPYVFKESGPIKWMVVETPGAVVQPNGLMQCDFVGTGAHASRVAALKAMCDFYPERRFAHDNEKTGKKEFMTELYPIGLVGPNTPEGRIARILEVLDGNEMDPATCMEMIENIVEGIHPGESRMLGEDYHFCHLARKAGFNLWSDRANLIPHIGDCEYPISPAQLSIPSQIPTHDLNLDKY